MLVSRLFCSSFKKNNKNIFYFNRNIYFGRCDSEECEISNESSKELDKTNVEVNKNDNINTSRSEISDESKNLDNNIIYFYDI